MQMSKWSENTQGRGGGSERRRSEGTKEKSDEDENSEKKDEEKKAKNLHAEIEEAIFHNLIRQSILLSLSELKEKRI